MGLAALRFGALLRFALGPCALPLGLLIVAALFALFALFLVVVEFPDADVHGPIQVPLIRVLQVRPHRDEPANHAPQPLLFLSLLHLEALAVELRDRLHGKRLREDRAASVFHDGVPHLLDLPDLVLVDAVRLVGRQVGGSLPKRADDLRELIWRLSAVPHPAHCHRCELAQWFLCLCARLFLHCLFLRFLWRHGRSVFWGAVV